MGYIPMTLIIVLGSSLFVALVINPVFASRFMKKDERKKPNKRKLSKYFDTNHFSLSFLSRRKYSYGLTAYCICGTLINGFFLTPLLLVSGFPLSPFRAAICQSPSLVACGIKPYLLLGGTVFTVFIHWILCLWLLVEFFPVMSPSTSMFCRSSMVLMYLRIQLPI